MFFYAVSLVDNKGEDDWRPGLRFVPTALLDERELRIKLEKERSKFFKFSAPANRYGTVSAFLILTDGERILPLHILNYAVLYKRKADFNYKGILMASCGEERFLPALKKMGVDWVRYEVGWDGFEPRKGEYSWKRYDNFMDECRKAKIYVATLTEGAPDWAKPKGDFLDIPYKDFKIKLDWSPGREYYPDWENAWREYLKRYSDVVRALNVWNEPWEGEGISGWKSTGEHYRELLRRVKNARDKVDPSVKIVAADSSHNTDWKLFSAGMENDIDVISIHYEFPVQSSYAFAMGKYYGKEVWDTETWFNWMGDAAILRAIIHELALGAKKVSPLVTNLIFDENGFPNTTPGWASALARFLDDKEFAGLAHPQRPPFVFLFKGKEENVAVAMTTLWTHYQYRFGYPWGQFSDDEVIMVIPQKMKIRLYDIYGNPLPLKSIGGKYEIPLNRIPIYIVSKGDFPLFKSCLSEAIYKNLKPVEIEVHQIGWDKSLRIDIKNVHPTTLKGNIHISAKGICFRNGTLDFKLFPLQTKSFVFKILRIDESIGNNYPSEIRVKTDKGSCSWREDLLIATIKRASIKVDGDISDWERSGAIPIPLSKVSGESSLLKAWFPWEQFSKVSSDFAAEVAFAYDEKNLYIMAKVKDTTKNILPSLLSGRNLHRFQNPPGDYVYLKAGPFPAAEGDMIKLSLSPLEDNKWNRKYDVFPPSSPLRKLGHYISANYQYLIYPTEEGAEIMRVRTPGFFYLHPLPIDYSFLARNCRVEGSSVIVKSLPEGYIYECSIPWSELKGIKPEKGKLIRMSVIVQNGDMGNVLELSKDKSLCSLNTLDFEPGWGVKWTAETEFQFGE